MDNGTQRLAALAIFQRLRAKAGRHIDAIVQEDGITPLQGCLLFQVADGARSVGEAGERLHIGQANTSTMCKKLEAAGYLKRCRSPRDERVVVLSLTEKGEAAVADIRRRAQRYEDAFADMPAALRRDFLRGLEAADAALDYLERYFEGDKMQC